MLSSFIKRLEKIPSYPWEKIVERTVLGFLIFALIWKGGKSLETTWLLTILAWMCTYIYWRTRPKKDPIPLIVWLPVIAFVVWTFLSFAFSSTLNYGLDEVFRTSCFALIFFWAFRRLKARGSNKYFSSFLDAIVIATLIAGLIGLFVYIFQPVNRFVGTFFDHRFHTDYWPNAWADWLLVSWPLIALWALQEKRRAQMFVRYLVLGILISFLLLSFSRGALIAFAGQLVLWGLWIGKKHWKKNSFPWKDSLVKIGITVLVSIVFFSGANAIRSQYFPVQSVSEKATFTSAEGASSISERASFWRQSFSLSLERPLFGWGPYSFRFVQPRLQNDVRATSDHAHNVLLKYVVERGWIATILFVFLLAVIFIKSVKQFKLNLSNERQGLIMIAIAGLIAHSLIDFNLQFVSIGLLFWMLLGMLSAEIKWGKARIVNKRLVRTFEVTLATIVLGIAIMEGQGMVLSSFGRHGEAKGNLEQALGWYKSASPQILSRDMHLSRAKILYDLKRLEEAKSAVQDYQNLNSEDYRGSKMEADILRSQRLVEDALMTYDEALMKGGMYNDFGIMRSKVELMIDASMWDELKEVKDGSIEMMKKYVDAIERNSHYIALSPNVEDVIDLANRYAEMSTRRYKPQYEVLAARADHHATLERGRVKARRLGYLW